MHNSRIEDASLKPERQLWDSFDGSEDGDGRSSNSANAARRTDPKKGNGMIQWPLLLGCCRCKGLMYAPLAHPNGPPAGAWWWTQRRMTRRRAMLSCTLLALVILGACAAGIAVQVLNLINNLRFRLDHVSVQGLDKCG